MEEKPVFEEQDYDLLTLAKAKRPRLFQIHGTLRRPHTLTRDNYRLWSEQHPRAYRHLEQLVLDKTALFVGYSLSDPHLDSLLAVVRKITAGREKRLYAWMWQLPEGKAKLLDRRDKIEAISIKQEVDWAAAFQQLRGALDRLLSSGGPGPATFPGGPGPVTAAVDLYAYDREQYLASLRARHNVTNLQALYQWGAGYARDDVSLTEVFVEPDLGQIVESLTDRAKEEEEEIADPTNYSLHEALKKREAEVRQEPRRKPASYVLVREARLVIVGAPGQGKSTLLCHWLLEETARWREKKAQLLPVYVRLADWELQQGLTEGRLLDYVKERLPHLGEISSIAISTWLKGAVLWLLDGVDEIRDSFERTRFQEEVLATAAQRPDDRWVVATRPAGEPAGRFAPGWTRTVLPTLSDRQVERVLENWGKVLERKEQLPLDHSGMARKLKHDRGLRGLRGNALLLTMAVLFYN